MTSRNYRAPVTSESVSEQEYVDTWVGLGKAVTHLMGWGSCYGFDPGFAIGGLHGDPQNVGIPESVAVRMAATNAVLVAVMQCREADLPESIHTALIRVYRLRWLDDQMVHARKAVKAAEDALGGISFQLDGADANQVAQTYKKLSETRLEAVEQMNLLQRELDALLKTVVFDAKENCMSNETGEQI